MWKTLKDEQQLVTQAYQVSQNRYSKEMYFVLFMRFEMFVEHKLTDSSDNFLVE